MSLDVYLTAERPVVVYERNITHNLSRMAKAAGLYEALWRPEEDLGATKARGLIEPLRLGLQRLLIDKERMKRLNPENGWGDYEGFVDFVETYLAACEDNPDASIQVSR